MDTFPYVYECARKQGSLPKLALPELGACGQCAAEVINAKGGEVDLQQHKSCQICYSRLADPETKEKDLAKSLEPMKQLIGCCGQGIKSHLADQAGQAETGGSNSGSSSGEPQPPSKPKPTNQKPPQPQPTRMPRPPTKDEILYHQFDEYDSDILLPRHR